MMMLRYYYVTNSKNLNWMWIWGAVLVPCSANNNGHRSCNALPHVDQALLVSNTL